MALEKIWLKKWQSLKKKTKRKGLLLKEIHCNEIQWEIFYM